MLFCHMNLPQTIILFSNGYLAAYTLDSSVEESMSSSYILINDAVEPFFLLSSFYNRNIHAHGVTTTEVPQDAPPTFLAACLGDVEEPVAQDRLIRLRDFCCSVIVYREVTLVITIGTSDLRQEKARRE